MFHTTKPIILPILFRYVNRILPYDILYAMAVGCSRAGRPCFVADIDFSNDLQLAFRDDFYAACAEFRYREIVALARACGVGISTVENWKYRMTFPRKDIAQQIIDWVARGKPMKQRRPFPEAVGML